jgi:hypothetical protein
MVKRLASGSSTTLSCIAYGIPLLTPCATTSSIEEFAQLDRHMGTPWLAAARETPSSLSLWATPWIPVGEKPSGKVDYDVSQWGSHTM